MFGGMLFVFAPFAVLDRNYFRNDQPERVRVQMAVARGLPDEAVFRVGSDEAGAGKIVNSPDQRSCGGTVPTDLRELTPAPVPDYLKGLSGFGNLPWQNTGIGEETGL